MARKKNDEIDEEVINETPLQAIVKSKYDTLMRRSIAGEKERASDAAAAREEIGDAVEKHNLHKKAFSWAKFLKKQAPAQRDELIWHLMTYFKYEGWPGEDLLDDRRPGEETNVTRLNHA